jgi:phage shock protein PspC (stress-responsive transcriptional regulator)
MAEFKSSDELLHATTAAYTEGYRRMDAYSPLPVEGLADALGFRHTSVPLIVLVAGFVGCVGGFFLQYWISAISYPVNVGGRPYNSWPSFVPVTFELTILVAALAALLGMLILNGLPMPYHPVFNVARFAQATKDRFFLCIEAADPKFDRDGTTHFLESLGPSRVCVVEQ